MFTSLRFKIAALLNRFHRRKGPSLNDRCASVIMNVCALQLERNENRELAPTRGAFGPILVSGGAIVTIRYGVFDVNADRVDKSIRHDPVRAFAKVVLRLTLERDPEFEAFVDGKFILATQTHRAPGVELITHLSQYFPLLPKPYTGRTYVAPPETTQ
jgi:hypothetical protein